LNITWIEEASISKLLGIPFGLVLTTSDVDKFLKEKITKKLQYWCTTRINSMGRGVIVNIVLLSSIMYFASIWGRMKKGLKKVTTTIQNYLWSSTLHRARTKVSWLQCCLTKDKGDINVINLVDAMTALMVK